MLYMLIKFVHVTAAMVFFGIPFAFGRWWHTATLADSPKARAYTIERMRLFIRLHLNASALVLLITGGWMARSVSPWPMWMWLSLIWLIAAIVNLHGNLGASLTQLGQDDSAAGIASLRKRIAIFIAIHHTLVTASTATMVFRWPQ